MRTVAYVLVVYAAVVLIVSPFYFHWASRGDWRLTPGGRHVMEYMAGLAFVMAITVASLVSRLTGHGPLPVWLSIVCWAVIGFVATRRLRILHQTRYRD